MIGIVATTRIEDILLPADCSLEEGIVNVKAIDPDYGAGLETITRGVAVATAGSDRSQPKPGA